MEKHELECRDMEPRDRGMGDTAHNTRTLDQVLIDDAKMIVETARRSGIVLRILGALAVSLHTSELTGLHKKLDRLGQAQQFTDLDLVAYGRQREGVHKVFEGLSYSLDKRVAAYFGQVRGIWYHPQKLYHVDVFYDKLPFCHEVSFGTVPGQGRIELDYPTITLADIVLEKMQIHDIGEKDIKDVVVLLRGHPLGEAELETVNVSRLCQALARDWGFYHDFQINMEKVLQFAEVYTRQGRMTAEDLEDIGVKVKKILDRAEAEPKTKEWLIRAKAGTTKQWWISVEEFQR